MPRPAVCLRSNEATGFWALPPCRLGLCDVCVLRDEPRPLRSPYMRRPRAPTSGRHILDLARTRGNPRLRRSSGRGPPSCHNHTRRQALSQAFSLRPFRTLRSTPHAGHAVAVPRIRHCAEASAVGPLRHSGASPDPDLGAQRQVSRRGPDVDLVAARCDSPGVTPRVEELEARAREHELHGPLSSGRQR